MQLTDELRGVLYQKRYRMSGYHDPGISHIKVRKGRHCYGMGLGIILLDEVSPAFPGDMRNPSAYSFPIQYEIARGVNNQTLVHSEDKSFCVDPLRRAARKLEQMGCRAIVTECGYSAYFQKALAECVDVPVFASSLLQVAWARQLLGTHQVVGVIVAFEQQITPAHLQAVGVGADTDYVLTGAWEAGKFNELMNMAGHPDSTMRRGQYEKIEKDLVDLAQDFCRKHANMGALVLECSLMQPFARAIQRTIDIPVFSWGTLLDYAYSVVAHRDYYGHV